MTQPQCARDNRAGPKPGLPEGDKGTKFVISISQLNIKFDQFTLEVLRHLKLYNRLIQVLLDHKILVNTLATSCGSN
jgi:hypothetical protein